MSDAPSPPQWRVVLIVEDDSDGRACRELARAAGLRAFVDWLPANGIGNIKRSGAKLIELAKDRVGKNGCVAVVIDGDRKTPSRHEPHRSIFQACRSTKVPLVIAREAIEAWFLTDPGICRWLGVAQPANTESLRDPKKTVADAFYKKTGRTYLRRRARLEVGRQATKPDVARSKSLADGMNHLVSCNAGST